MKRFIRFLAFILGMGTLAFGIALMIIAELGSAPWDVLHIGLYKQFGLTIGTWSIIVGFFILMVSALLSKAWPKLGAYLNMLLVGIFIDFFLWLPWLNTPESLPGQWMMLIAGVLIMGWGMGIYISADYGAGPRDSLMLALSERSHWGVGKIRSAMEVGVLAVGWFLGGPVFWGTLLVTFGIGIVVGQTIPLCRKAMNYLVDRRDLRENINQGKIRANHYDRVG
ncbi:YitT family protein [Bacillaceae bacterium SIJ1]|uniref:YczE/YyaS/YitT family protein n=1 Tax=Litoribacterium kuwaitense TaxID=1398745 RepID=UPI0013EC906D|nr:YitT family protein [Litoribacterium kuwaitense]NGP43450.1 YitT family protein [Litoribacterium kuwaitense]